ncbi:MAG TPA: hypothetical protein VFA70_10150 [Dehalococcoidia bacterium]|nr:hypothetical protein [Dehalococcoidia bacterium]
MARSAAQAHAQHAWYKRQQFRRTVGDVIVMDAKRAGPCSRCERGIRVGDRIAWNALWHSAQHVDCTNPTGAVAIPLDVQQTVRACRVCGLTKAEYDAAYVHKLATTKRPAEYYKIPCTDPKRAHEWKTRPVEPAAE